MYVINKRNARIDRNTVIHRAKEVNQKHASLRKKYASYRLIKCKALTKKTFKSLTKNMKSSTQKMQVIQLKRGSHQPKKMQVIDQKVQVTCQRNATCEKNTTFCCICL